jgi:hypothetical protein
VGSQRLTAELRHSLHLARYYYNDAIKDDEVDSACSMYENKEKCMQRFLYENLKEREGLENIGLDWSIILERISNEYYGKMFIDLIFSGYGLL